MAGAIHHTVIACRNLEASLAFYRDGLGLEVLADREVEGDWPTLFGAPSRRLRAVFLGDLLPIEAFRRLLVACAVGGSGMGLVRAFLPGGFNPLAEFARLLP